nr:hypothetical protein [Tanacetum cinerariifolium]
MITDSHAKAGSYGQPLCFVLTQVISFYLIVDPHLHIEVLSENYSSTEQINSIQQMISFCLMTGQRSVTGYSIHSGENFGSLPGIMSNSNFSKDPSKVTKIKLTAHMIVVNNQKDLVSPLPFSGNKKKVKSQTMTPTLPKSQGPKGTTTDPKDLGGNVQPADKGLPSMIFDESTVKTTSYPEGPCGDNDSEGLKPPADMKPLTNFIADPLGTDVKYQAYQTQSTRLSDDEEVSTAEEEIDEDIPPTNEEVHTERDDLLKALNGVTETLKVVQEVIKEDPALNKKVLEATEAYITNSNNITELLSLAKTFDFSGLKSLVEIVEAALDAHNDHLET